MDGKKNNYDFSDFGNEELIKRQNKLDEIAKLGEEQNQDDVDFIKSGRERPISSFTSTDDNGVYDSILDKLHSTSETPEGILIKKEDFQNLFEEIEKLGDDYLEVFLALNDNASVQETADELSVNTSKIIDMIKHILSSVDQKYADFFKKRVLEQRIKRNIKPELEGENIKLTNELAEEDYLKKDEVTGRVYLTDAAKELSLDKLKDYLKTFGYNISRVTVYRAQKKGYFTPDYHGDNRVYGAEVIELSEDEKFLTLEEIMSIFNVDIKVAKRIKNNGYYRVDTLKKDDLDKIPPVKKGKIKSAFIKQIVGGKSFILKDAA